MSKKPNIDSDALLGRVQRVLASQGPLSSRELVQLLEISQPAFSRLSRRLDNSVRVTGKASATRYSLKRVFSWLDSAELPVFEIDKKGEAAKVAILHGIQPQGFYLESFHPEIETRFYTDLPYWLDDMRPSGFLGRLIPRQHPDLGLPTDVRTWSTDQSLSYLSRFGWNSVGSFIVGEEALRLHWEFLRKTPDTVSIKDREKAYPARAEQVLESGTAGSSAGGEQPKFLVTRTPNVTAVLVKFSPPVKEKLGRRRADLLVAEHLANEVMIEHGHSAARSALLQSKDRIFLESERFDRLGAAGRRGVLSLNALDLEWVGCQGSWSAIAEALLRKKKVSAQTCSVVRSRALFGEMIGNSDMHAGNLAFFSRGERIDELTPVYDMLPMMYAPQNDQLIERKFAPAPPRPADAEVWEDAWNAARDFWSRVSKHEWVSADFKKIARVNEKTLAEQADYVARLKALRKSKKS